MTDPQHEQPDVVDGALVQVAQQQQADALTATRDDLIGDAFGEASRPLTRCIACAQVDDHPMHSVQVEDGSGAFVDWHMDCHAQVIGCSSCSAVVASRPEGATGADFLAHVLDFGGRQAAPAGQED